MRIAATALLASVMAGLGPAAAETLRLGVAAPVTGASQILGRQVVAGATAAAGEADVDVVDDRCTAEGGASAAAAFVAKPVKAVVGFLCTESLEAAMPVLAKAGIPVVTPGVRSEWITDRHDRTKWPLYRLAPRGDAESKAAARILVERWRNDPFALVDDGTIYGRDLVETLRDAAQRSGLRPVFNDTFRPQMENQVALVGRLRRSGATRVFVGGERDDVAIIARDIAALGAAITVVGGEVLRADGAVPLPAGVLMVGLPEWADIADAATLAALRDKGVEPEGYVLPSYAAMQVALQLTPQLRSGPESQTALAGGPYATVLGDVGFDGKGDLTRDLFGLFRFDGQRFVPADGP